MTATLSPDQLIEEAGADNEPADDTTPTKADLQHLAALLALAYVATPLFA